MLLLYLFIIIVLLICIYIYITNNIKQSLILYVYKESENSRKNLEYFVNHGILKNNNYTYVILINDYICTVDIPDQNNIIVLKKKNEYDIQSYQYAFNTLYKSMHKYDYFFFINSSCIGPFTPTYNKDWIEIITNMFINNVRLIGPIIEVPNDNYGLAAYNNEVAQKVNKGPNIPFIHTYMFAVDKVGLNVLTAYPEIFNPTKYKKDLVYKTERLISSAMLLNGYNIRSLLLKYKNVNWLNKNYWDYYMWNTNNKYSDPEIPNNYDGLNVNPLEVMFIKNIRDVNETRLKSQSGIDPETKKYLKLYNKWEDEASQR